MKRVMAMLTLAGLCCSSVSVAAAKTSEDKGTVGPATVAVQAEPVAAALDDHVKRPAILPALYASLGALQAWDVYTTSRAVRSGAREVNPVIAPLTGHLARTIALKAATTAGTVLFVERLWRQSRVAAVVVLAVTNGATMAVAMNNLRNVRRSR